MLMMMKSWAHMMSSLFIEVPLDETIDHIIHEIYTNNKLSQLSSKLLFRRLLCNVTKNTVFSFNDKLYKQINGCGMGNPLSPVLPHARSTYCISLEYGQKRQKSHSFTLARKFLIILKICSLNHSISVLIFLFLLYVVFAYLVNF